MFYLDVSTWVTFFTTHITFRIIFVYHTTFYIIYQLTCYSLLVCFYDHASLYPNIKSRLTLFPAVKTFCCLMRLQQSLSDCLVISLTYVKQPCFTYSAIF